MTFRQKAHQLIDLWPDEPTLEQVRETAYQLIEDAMINEGRTNFKEGHTLSNDEVKQRMARWLSKSGPPPSP